MKNFHIFLLSASFVALVVGFSAYKLANPDRNSIASQNETGDSQSTLGDKSSFQNSLVPVPENSPASVQSSSSLSPDNTNPVIDKSAVPPRKTYNRESEEEDED